MVKLLAEFKIMGHSVLDRKWQSILYYTMVRQEKQPEIGGKSGELAVISCTVFRIFSAYKRAVWGVSAGEWSQGPET